MSFFDWVRGTSAAVVETVTAPLRKHGRWELDSEQASRHTVGDRVAALARGPRAVGKLASTIVGDSGESQCELPSPGSTMSDSLTMWYANQSFIGHQLAALVAQQWLVLKACDMPARDALRNGWRVTGAAKSYDADIDKLDKRMGIKRVARDYLTKGRIFGIRIAIPRIAYEDPATAYAMPFNPDGVKPGMFQGWVTVDPYWTAPVVTATAPDQPDFYDPTYWVINGMRYHRSHLVIYRHGMLADILKPAYYYGGIPLPQLIMERVYGAERSANEAPLLALSKRTVVYKTDLEKAMANYDVLQAKTRQMTEFWNNFGVRVIDKEADEHEQYDTALADLDALIMTQYQLVAAVAEVPSTKLLGTSPKGFNATGESDTANYHEMLESLQETDLQPLLDRHYLLVQRHLDIAEPLSAEWNPLAVPTTADKAAATLSRAQADAALVGAGVVGPDEVRSRLNSEDGGDYEGQLEGEAPEPAPLPSDETGGSMF